MPTSELSRKGVSRGDVACNALHYFYEKLSLLFLLPFFIWVDFLQQVVTVMVTFFLEDDSSEMVIGTINYFLAGTKTVPYNVNRVKIVYLSS